MDSILRCEIKKPIATTYVVFFCLVSPLKWASEALIDSLSRWEINRSMVFFRLVSPHKDIYNQLYGRAFALEEFIKMQAATHHGVALLGFSM
jgi:hypothetical protein